ncbi:MAG: VOC family protein [Patescibacteria group bacterium]
MPKITPYLWFDKNAEEAMNFYLSIFKDAKQLRVDRTPTDYPNGKAGEVITCSIELLGQTFHLLNGGPNYHFTPAVSFMIDCEDQAEVDYYWDNLLADGGKADQCGWLVDKYGLSWQVVPKALDRLMRDSNPAKAAAVMQAMMEMIKLDVNKLQEAYDQAE